MIVITTATATITITIIIILLSLLSMKIPNDSTSDLFDRHSSLIINLWNFMHSCLVFFDLELYLGLNSVKSVEFGGALVLTAAGSRIA